MKLNVRKLKKLFLEAEKDEDSATHYGIQCGIIMTLRCLEAEETREENQKKRLEEYLKEEGWS